ncbi:hypothetical protein Ciccas_013969 [Cichlidogyrus casuarinus]|uniref:Uncharacterized protein n=1 Tax=Cichlidogyrus casuarinus TaxID=1844966 RepID=A0ABD2PJA5_9PLAT
MDAVNGNWFAEWNQQADFESERKMVDEVLRKLNHRGGICCFYTEQEMIKTKLRYWLEQYEASNTNKLMSDEEKTRCQHTCLECARLWSECADEIRCISMSLFTLCSKYERIAQVSERTVLVQEARNPEKPPVEVTKKKPEEKNKNKISEKLKTKPKATKEDKENKEKAKKPAGKHKIHVQTNKDTELKPQEEEKPTTSTQVKSKPYVIMV